LGNPLIILLDRSKYELHQTRILVEAVARDDIPQVGIDLETISKEHEDLISLMRNENVEIVLLPSDPRTNSDSVFTHEPALFTPFGIVSLTPPSRLGEGPAMREFLEQEPDGVKIIGQLKETEQEFADGGDLLWLDDRTLLAGRTFRTNDSAINSLKQILKPFPISVIEVQLPYYKGKSKLLHLHSVLSTVGEKLVVGYKPLLPVSIVEYLETNGFTFIEVSEEEFLTGAANVLAIQSRKVILMTGNPKTKKEMEVHGCQVIEWVGNSIQKEGGGPKCLFNGTIFTHCPQKTV